MMVPEIEVVRSPLNRLCRKVRSFFGFKVPLFPRTIRMTTFVDEGCLFRIMGRIEELRIEHYGKEKDFTKRIIDEIRIDDIVYDIGSCLGLVAINAAAKAARVLAFEPDPSYRERLKYNIALNRFANIEVIDWAVSDTEGEVTLFISGPVSGRSPSLRKGEHTESVSVRTMSIDGAIARAKIPPPTILKMDIEGAEILALRGMRSLLESRDAPRSIFIEIHSVNLESFGSSAEQVLSLITSSGYIESYRMSRLDQIHCIFHKDT